MTRRIWFIADDYGIAPGVDRAIAHLLEHGRLSGTGCMTVFPQWRDTAASIASLPPDAAIGLHLTLTDQPPLTGRSTLAPDGRLPGLRSLLAMIALRRVTAAAIAAELDAQLDAFRQATGREPDYIDGHQHVHFLWPVRQWLARLRPTPRLRGAPMLSAVPRAARLKAAVVGGLARGFNRAFATSLVGPLAGFYDWNDEAAFAGALELAAERLPDGGLFMCHPGHIDEALRARDPLLEPRERELAMMASDAFPSMLARHGVAVARLPA